MRAFKITVEEAQSLEGKEMPSGGFYNPEQDKFGDWFIFEIEHNSCGLGVEAEFIAPPSPEN